MHLSRLGAITTALLVSSATVTLSTGPARAQTAYSCRGQRATIVGSSAGDRLVGTPHKDVIVGRGGDDRIDGRGGDDVICGNRGADVLSGGSGDDRLYGGLDRLRTDRGGQWLQGDTLRGGSGDDWLAPGYDQRRDDETVYSDVVTYDTSTYPIVADLSTGSVRGAGHDHVVVTRRFLFAGSPGDDAITGSGHGDIINGLAGDDVINSRGGDDQVFTEADRIRPPADDDVVRLGPGDDTVYSESGRDRLYGGGGNDQLVDYSHRPEQVWGGAGRDSLTAMVSSHSGLVVNGGGGRDDVTLYDTLPDGTRALLVIDRAHQRLDLETDPVATGTVDLVEAFTFMGEHLNYRYLGTSARDRLVDYTGNHVRAVTRAGDDYVDARGPHNYIDTGAGDDFVKAAATATCLNWERGSC